MPGNARAAISIQNGGSVNGSMASADLMSAGGGLADNSVNDTRLVQVTLQVSALVGGTSPAVTLTMSRAEVDNCGNMTGVFTVIDNPAGLTAVGQQVRNIGPNQTIAARLSRLTRIAVAVTGAPTSVQWEVFASLSD